MIARGHDCSVSRHADQRTGGWRICLSWVPGIASPHPGVGRRASRNYVLELTLSPTSDILFSYSGCGISTQQTQRIIPVGSSLERELDALFLEFEAASYFTHHTWFVAPLAFQAMAPGRETEKMPLLQMRTLRQARCDKDEEDPSAAS